LKPTTFAGEIEEPDAMVELITTGFLTVGSVLLLAYWFRYMCLLILSAKTTQDYAAQVATANQLSFLEVQSQLGVGAYTELDRLHAALDRDYALLTYLLKHAAGGQSSMESRMLEMNYRLVSTWARVSRGFSPAASRRALEEMSLVVAHFANIMGERSACGSAA
jgi:hypothetical protein